MEKLQANSILEKVPFSELNGLRVFGFSKRSQLLAVAAGMKGLLVGVNAEKIMSKDGDLRRIINGNLTVAYPDGAGSVLALRRKGLDAIKIPGAEFWLDIVREFPEKRLYLVGAAREVVEATVKKLRSEFPGVCICGYRDGYLKEGDQEKLSEDIQAVQPDVVFVAMGSPRQEILMDSLFAKHSALYMDLGGSFDVYTGVKKRAPRIFIRLNLEWLYRLFQEPGRIWRQTVLLVFFLRLVANRL